MRTLKNGGASLTKRELDGLLALAVEGKDARSLKNALGFIAPATKPEYRTKAERAAGKGFPCTASPNCGRKDLRYEASGISHDSTQPKWHTAAK